ncbi:p-loop containing nucleoside triphosphate hydrolase protein [Favolaschia claudopus]|uniref:P-loop containing nucleoside triphosphate hydrolase protein n=1 Tax=Favolaschia claudopus TaxID=2862362 RepID=A0AAW0ADR8_9AGAR
MPLDYRRKLKADFEAGKVRVLIVTDTAAYGFDVRNIRRVITTDFEESEDDFGDSIQRWGRAGRDGQLAEVIAFAPPWVRNLPEGTAPSTKAEQDNEDRRNKLGPIREFFNPTIHFCSRHATLHHNSEPFPLNNITADCCGPIHDPNASSVDLANVQKWQELFAQRAAESSEGSESLRPRGDGAFRALDKAMRESLTHMLDRWSHRKWDEIRPSREIPCSVFFPPFVLEAILDKAHLCFDLDNLKLIARDWEYLDECGALLLKFLVETMSGFDQIYDELVNSEGSDDGGKVPRSPEARAFARQANISVLKELCRENGCKVGGNTCKSSCWRSARSRGNFLGTI